jgi:hypothetical protein
MANPQMVQSLIQAKASGGLGLYFDPIQKKYHNLVPLKWSDAESKSTFIPFDFSIWDTLPDKELPNILFQLLNQLPKKYAGPLLDEIAIGSLVEMTKNEGYAKALNLINDEDKRTFVAKKISTLVLPRQEKKEKGALLKFFKPGANEMLDQLLLHIVRGEQKEAEELIRVNPKLLLQSGRVTDYSGRRIEGTALQLALGAEDVEMSKMITFYLDIYNPSEKFIQYQKQFPPDENKEKNTQEMKALEAVTRAILDAKEGDITTDHADLTKKIHLTIREPSQTATALDQFKEMLKPKGFISQGKHFNAALLLKALELYGRHYNDFGGDKTSPKAILFWRQVIGYIQRFLPACYLQEYLRFYDKGQEKITRSLETPYTRPLFPLQSDSGLGYDFTATTILNTTQAGEPGDAERFRKLCQKKDSAFAKLIPSSDILNSNRHIM